MQLAVRSLQPPLPGREKDEEWQTSVLPVGQPETIQTIAMEVGLVLDDRPILTKCGDTTQEDVVFAVLYNGDATAK